MDIIETLLPSKPPLPWRTRLAILMISIISDVTRRANGTFNRRLLNFFDFKLPPFPNMSIYSVFSSDIPMDPSCNLWFRLYTPTNSGVNGGGGDSSLPVFARKVHAIVISVNYRLAPEHRYPSQYDDGFDVLWFLDDNRANGLLPPNADLSKCFLVGDSSGANLAHNVTVRACRSKFRVLNIIGLVSIQPFFGGQERTGSEIQLAGCPFVSLDRTDWCWKVFLPNGSNRDHHAANVSGPNAEDISDWQMKYYRWLKRSGKDVSLIEYPNMFHAFYAFPDLSDSSNLFSQRVLWFGSGQRVEQLLTGKLRLYIQDIAIVAADPSFQQRRSGNEAICICSARSKGDHWILHRV
ncbi:unnamed protein product [Dovyalis caffra]|uniref:Alpha/beta hydrolase fold-3 domain-containing protein n=1 Tax=Dovyalis caffra TaxID=77055 RepID=A0AAV1S4X5_9ROSI|nr:unnamed protein product [Dovyalis caffra]